MLIANRNWLKAILKGEAVGGGKVLGMLQHYSTAHKQPHLKGV